MQLHIIRHSPLKWVTKVRRDFNGDNSKYVTTYLRQNQLSIEGDSYGSRIICRLGKVYAVGEKLAITPNPTLKAAGNCWK